MESDMAGIVAIRIMWFLLKAKHQTGCVLDGKLRWNWARILFNLNSFCLKIIKEFQNELNNFVEIPI